MSAPSAGSPNGSPVPGYYPDPSIPGYIRYWNGSTWAPGTSRPAPGPGEPAPAPPPEAGGVPAARTSDPAPEEPREEEDDRDEIDLGRAQSQAQPRPEALPEVRRRGEVAAHDPAAGQEFADWDDPRRLHGGAPDAGSAWQADPAQQSGFGDDRQDLSWGSAGATPAPPPPEAGALEAGGGQDLGSHDMGGQDLGGPDPRAAWDAPAAQPPAGEQPPPPDHTVAMRMPQRRPGASGHGAHLEGAGQPAAPDHTVAMRMPRPGTDRPAPGDPAGQGAQGQGAPGQGPYGQDAHGQDPHGQGAPQPEPTVGLRRSDVLDQGGQGGPAADAAPQGGQQPAAYHQPPAQHDPYAGQGHGAPQGAPAGQDAARPAWAQQVQHLAQQGAGQPPAQAPGGPQIPGQPHPGGPGAPGAGPWRPPADNPFADAAQEARPAGLGRRLVARLIDGLVVNAVVGAVAFPFVGKWTEHVQDEIEAANQAGVTRTVWLVDGTTGVYLAIVLGAFLLFGLLYEALPTAKWGRTAGKKLLGVRVVDIESQDAPGFGAALRRWLTYGVLSLVVLGVLNVLWCLFDRPWRQCWHDKAARTFVAGG